MKSKKKQRLLALILSMVLMLSASISALAEGDVQTEASGTETTENQAAAQSLEGETVPETEAPAEETGIAPQSEETSTEPVQESTEQEVTEETTDTTQPQVESTEVQEEPAVIEEIPAEEQPEEIVSEATELKQEFTDENGNVTQTVTAYVPEGAFQATADQISMEVSLLNTDDTNYIKGMMEKLIPENYYLDGYVLYQINFVVNGEITEPAKAITISVNGNDLAVEDTQKAHVFYYVPEDPEVEGDEDQLTEVIQKDQLIKSLEESGQSTENIEDYDYSEITVNEGNADTITVKGLKSTIYGCYVEKEAVTELTYEDDSVTVTVSADEAGIIPDGAELSVTPIIKTEITDDMSEEEKAQAEEINAQYDFTEEQLQKDSEENDTTMEGFLAYDICFLVDGEEVEPSGDVKVVMDFKEAAVPEGVSEGAEVTVKHLKEDESAEDGVVVEDMTEAASVETTENVAVQKVELTAESFSCYTIYWYSNWNSGTVRDTVEVHYVDTEGNPLDNLVDGGTSREYGTGSNNAITLSESDYNVSIEGYSYQYATVAANFQDAPDAAHIYRLQLNQIYSNYYIQYSTSRYGSAFTNIGTNQDVYMVYEYIATDDTANQIRFNYVPAEEISDATWNDNIAGNQYTMNYTIVLLDSEGNEIDTGSGSVGGVSLNGYLDQYINWLRNNGRGDEADDISYPESVTFNTNHLSVSAATINAFGITIPGFTFEDGYAYFYWSAHWGGAKTRVTDIANMGTYSDRYGTSWYNYLGYKCHYWPVGAENPEDDYYAPTVDYYSNELNGIDTEDYLAYQPNGVLRLVFRQVDDTIAYNSNFVDAYNTSNYQLIEQIPMNMHQSNNQWVGNLAEVTDIIPTKEGYTFDGWYMDVDANGNGTGTKIESPADDSTEYTQDAYYYARWVPITDPGGNPDDNPTDVPHAKQIDWLGDTGNNTDTALRGDSYYRLYLNATGIPDEIPEGADIVFILDTSNSMNFNMAGTEGNEWDEDESNDAVEIGTRRLDYVKSAAIEAIQTIQEASNQAAPINIGLVTFNYGNGNHDGTYENGTKILSYFTADYENLINMVENLEKEDLGGRTNYEAAFAAADVLLDTSSQTNKYVVFITDGETNGYTEGGTGFGGNNVKLEGQKEIFTRPLSDGGSGDGNKKSLEEANMIAHTWTNLSGFYTIAVSENIAAEDLRGLGPSGVSRLDMQANDEAAIHDAFNAVVSAITKQVCNVTITDQLSEYVEFVDNAGNTLSGIETPTGDDIALKVTKTIGGETTVIDSSDYTVTIDTATKTVSVNFGEDYFLDPGATYTISFNVKLTDAAFSAESSAFTRGDDGTDYDKTGNATSSGQEGLLSNETAQVIYSTMTGGVLTEHRQNYDDPVVKVPERHDWQLVKKSSSSDGAYLAGATFTLTSQDESTQYTGTSIEDNSETKDIDELGYIIWTLNGATIDEKDIPAGTYILEETVAPAGYSLSNVHWEIVVRNTEEPIITPINADGSRGDALTCTEITEGHKSHRFVITNDPLYSLPSAGGPGIFLYMIGGTLFLITGSLMIYINRRRGC